MRDRVITDLIAILEECKPLDGSARVVSMDDLMSSVINEEKLLTMLSIYTVTRDHEIWLDGYYKGVNGQS